VKRLLTLRRDHPVFRRKRFLTGAAAAELGWYNCAGEPVSEAQWADPTMHAIAVYLDGTDAPDEADDGTPLLDDDFLLLVNAFWEEVTFTIPPVREDQQRGLSSWIATIPKSLRLGCSHGTRAILCSLVRARCRSCEHHERKASQVAGLAAGAATAVRLARAKALWPPDKGDYTCGTHRPPLCGAGSSQR